MTINLNGPIKIYVDRRIIKLVGPIGSLEGFEQFRRHINHFGGIMLGDEYYLSSVTK